MRILAWLDRLTGQASDGLVFLGAVAMVLMVLHVVADVCGRFFFNHPLPGTLETVTIYYMVMVTVLPFSYVNRTQGQIVVELFTQKLSPRNISGLNALVGLLTLLFMVVLTWKTGQEAIYKTAIGEVRETGDTTILAWPTRWFLPAGMGVMAFAVALRIIADARAFLGRR